MALKELQVGEVVEEEETPQPFALPAPTDESLDRIQEGLFNEVRQSIADDPDPMFNQIEWGESGAGSGLTPSGGKGKSTGLKELPAPPPPEAPPPEEDENGYWENAAKLAAKRALDLTGALSKEFGTLGEELHKKAIPDEYLEAHGLDREKILEGGPTQFFKEVIPDALAKLAPDAPKKYVPELIKKEWGEGEKWEAIKSAVGFIGETGIESIPDMIAVSLSMPAYIAARTQEIGDIRAEGRDKEDAALAELMEAAPAAVFSALFERFGVKGITAQFGKKAAERIAKEAVAYGFKAASKRVGAAWISAGTREGGTEFVQEGIIEYLGENYGINDLSVAEGMERGLWASLAGTGAGGTAGATGAVVSNIMRPGPEAAGDTGGTDGTGGVTPPPVGDANIDEEASSYEVTVDGTSEAERTALDNQLDTKTEPAAKTEPTTVMSEAEKVALEEVLDRQLEESTETSAAPKTETATTDPTPTVAPKAPVVAEPSQEDEVITGDDLVTEPTPEVTPEPEVAPVENPMIQRGMLEEQFEELNTRTKGGMPGIRRAVRELGTAINAFFPDSGLPGLKGTIGAKRMADYFASLDEEVKIGGLLPNLKEFLNAVVDSPDAASAVQNLNRLKDYVVSSMPAIETEGGPVLAQANKEVARYDAKEAKRLSKAKTVEVTDKKTGAKKKVTRIGGKDNRLKARAVTVDELATTVEALVTRATELGIDVPVEVTETIPRARSYRKSTDIAKPSVLKGGAGAVVTKLPFTGKNLNEVSSKLRAAAGTLAQQISEAEAKSGDTKAKAPTSSSVTEAVSEPKKPVVAKKAATAKKTSKKKAAAKRETKKAKEAKRVAAEIEKGEKDLKEAMAKKPKVKTKGEAIVETSKKKTQTKKKGTKKVKGVKPGEVFDPEPKVISGKQSTDVVRDLGFGEGVSLAEAYEESGITGKVIKQINGMLAAVSGDQQKGIITAIRSYRGPEDNLRVLTQVSEITGQELSPELSMGLLQFVEGMHEKRVDMGVGDVRSDMIAEYAAAHDMSIDDAEFYLENAGEIEPELEDNYDRSETQPDFARYDRKTLLDYDSSLDHTNQSRSDRILLSKSMDKMREFFGNLTQPSSQDGFLKKLWNIKDIPKVTAHDVLVELGKNLPKNHRYTILVERLKELNLTVPVTFHEDLFDIDESETVLGSHFTGAKELASGRIIYDPRGAYVKAFYNPGQLGDAKFVHNVLHEIVHAATVHAYQTDVGYQVHMKELWRQALVGFVDQHPDVAEVFSDDLRAKIKDANIPSDEILDVVRNVTGNIKTFYGLANPIEMIAEAFTNPRFQMFLGSLEVKDTPELFMLGTIQSEVAGAKAIGKRPPLSIKSILGQMMWAIKKFLGYSARNSVLNEVLFSVDRYGMEDQQGINRIVRGVALGDKGIWGTSLPGQFNRAEDAKVNARSDIVDSQRNLNRGIKQAFKTAADKAKELGRKFALAFRNRDVIERKNRALFERAAKLFNLEGDPMAAFTHAKNSVSAKARKYEKKAAKLVSEFAKLDVPSMKELKRQMRNVTMANVWPDRSLKDPLNAHLWTKPDKNGRVKLTKAAEKRALPARREFDAFQKANPKAAKLLMKMAAMTKEIHDAKVRAAMFALGESFGLDPKEIVAMEKAKTAEDIDAIFDPDIVEKISKRLEDDSFKKTEAETKLLKTAIKEYATREAAAKTAKEILRESSIKGVYFPLRRYGQWVVSTPSDVEGEDRFMSTHTTKIEAIETAKRVTAEGTPVQLSKKIGLSATANDVNAVVAALQRKIPAGPTRDRLNAAVSEVLASKTTYQSQLKRKNIDGVAAEDMARAFEEYVHVSKYSIGDMLSAHKVTQALKDMNRLKANDGGLLSPDEVERLADVVDEIETRNKYDSEERNRGTAQRITGLIGFLNYLGAPSYWALNATQTATITLPVLASKYGLAKTLAAMGKGDATVVAAVAATLKSKDKSYEGFKAQLPAAARNIVEQLELDGVIQSTIAHEFGDVFQPGAWNRMRENAIGAPVAKTFSLAMEVMEKVPEAVEHFNRITTALATYNLSNGDLQATIDAVNSTQFNYDTNNRGRLLKTLPGGGGRGLVSPIMMFKTYGLGVMELLYGAIFDVVMTKGSRAEAGKLAAGLITSHTLFGGVAGGVMVAPVMAIQSAVNYAFKEVDDEWDLPRYAEDLGREIGGDTLATAFRRGVPAALLGNDWSRSVNLGNLVLMSNDRTDYSDVESATAGFAEIAFGPIGDYAIRSFVEGRRLLTGDTRSGLAEFAEQAIPLKAYRGMSQAVRYSLEGITTSGNLEMISPEDFTAILQTAMGFQATQKTEIQSHYYGDLSRDQRRAKRKSEIVKKIQKRIENGQNIEGLIEDAVSYSMSVPDSKYKFTSGELAMLRSRQRTSQREFDKKYKYSK